MWIPRRRLLRSIPLTLALAGMVPLRAAEDAKAPEIRPGDHIAIIGNTLADRMQHDGWLETYLHARFPGHDLVIRDLGFSGDELTLRLRSADFGSPDDWLTSTGADVIFAFFGYNESFAGASGLETFKKDLDGVIKHTLGRRYNGKTAPRMVLFSPIAHEDLHDRNLPDGSENNRRLELYTTAMREVARTNGVPFVDLFGPTRELESHEDHPLTIDGVHLNEHGNHLLAKVIGETLFPGGPKLEPKQWERLRQAVLDKNFHWFNRYRTVDGYSIFGGRADLAFVDGQTNRVVMRREMEVLDVMTANRDRRIWAVARGGDLAVDDGNTPPFIPVKTNKPGPGPNGEHVFLDGEEAIKSMTVAKGMKVNLFASEKDFPEVVNPVQMSFDARGRLWVAVWPTYPHWKPKEEMNDKLLILEDTDGDGKADKRTVFADKLHCPTGFEFANGGAIVAQAPDLVFLKDTDGDDRADVRTRILGGLDSADTHHTANSFALDPGGALYFQEGTFHHTQVETPYGPPVRNANAGVYRYEPRTQKFEVYITHGFANPHGHAFDRWGQDIVVDGTGANPYHAALFSGHLDYPNKHPRPPQVYQQRTRPCPGIEVLSSRHFPEANQGTLLVGNVIGFQGILQYKINDVDSSFSGSEVEPILSSTDPNFRPTDIEVGPDGAIYFLDWQNPIIGHMQHNLRDPSRDRTHGRVYRITAEGRPLLKPVPISGAPIEKLLDLLKEPEDRVRYRAKLELATRDTDRVIAAARTWIEGLDKNDPEFEHTKMEALWLHQYLNVVDRELLGRMLASPDFRARAAATRVLCYWRDRLPDALERLKTLAADPYPRVRLEAVRAASFFEDPEAIEVPLISAEHPSDVYLEFTRTETMKVLEPFWKKAVAEGKPIPLTSDAGARFFLGHLSTGELLKMRPGRAVDHELLFREGVRDEDRQAALARLSKLETKSESRVLLDAILGRDRREGVQDESVGFDLGRLLAGRNASELVEIRGELERMATAARLPLTRQLGLVALVAADGGVDRFWDLGTRSVPALVDVLGAIPLIRDPGLRASLFPKVEPLLHGLPKPLAGPIQAKGSQGRYVRIELPGIRTLTLAEVEVFSDGRNVARQGRASQKNTGYGGEAKRGIDGKTSGNYGDGGQTHSEENTRDPWWEVDLGSEFPIDSIAIHNRTEGEFGRRLDGYSVKVLDSARAIVFEKAGQPAPAASATFEVGGGGAEGRVRRAAMIALTTMRGQEAPTFQSLARFVREGIDRDSAIRAIQRIPAAYWPTDEARALVDSLIASLRQLPVADRTSEAALDALQLGDALAAILPGDQAASVRHELGELGVRAIHIGTVPDQMLFDKDRIVVQAGRPVMIVFENSDIMPHNFVVTRPGALERVGLLAESTATQPGAIERDYVPALEEGVILLASRLLQPRTAQKLNFTAPSQVGIYPYVCTYPGHWRRMYGGMVVVEDLDAYLANPDDYLAKRPIPAADVLLKSTRARREWTFEELAPLVEQAGNGRSFGDGKQLFQVANCVSCHKLNGVGLEIGPDLAKLDAKWKPADILRDILEPSARIEEKFATTVLATESGQVVTGLVIDETPDAVKLVENPLTQAPPVFIKKSVIAERKTSATSIMPKGLLDKLTREEVLDLVAYIVARGDANHPLFQGGGHEHHHDPGH